MNTQLRYFTLLTWIFVAVPFFAGCGGQAEGDAAEQKEKTESTEAETRSTEGPEYTSAYVCPMHCEGSGSEEPGSCPVCGMDYVALTDHEGDGHQHDHSSHEGHSH